MHTNGWVVETLPLQFDTCLKILKPASETIGWHRDVTKSSTACKDWKNALEMSTDLFHNKVTLFELTRSFALVLPFYRSFMRCWKRSASVL